MITEKATYYLVYAALVVVSYIGDQIIKKGTKTHRIIGYIVSLLADFAILGYGIYLYEAKGESQTGFVLGGILFILCILCLFGRYWQNKEKDKKTDAPAD